MNITDAIKDSRSKRLHIAAIAVTTIATVLVSLYCLFSGTFIVFQNLFYVPIVLSCMYYTMRGFIYSVCLAALYMALILFFTLESGVIMQASIRVALFIVIAGIVTFLSIRRKQAEEALRESETTFRIHVENSFDVIFTLDKEGTFVFLSPAWERHFGYPTSEAIGKRFDPFVHPDDVAPCVEHLMRVLNTGQSETSPPFRVKHTDGGWRLFVANGTCYVDTKGERMFIGVGRDITAQRQVEDALRESEEKYRALYESMNELAALHEVVHDKGGSAADYRILDCNPAFSEVTGISREQAVGRLASDLYGADKAPYLNTFAHVADTGDPAHIEGYFAPMKKHFSISVSSPKKGYFVTITSDITSRKEAEQKLEQSSALLGEVERMAKVGGWEVDAKTLGLTWTEETGRIYELPPGYIPPLEDGINYFHPDDRTKLKEAVGRALENGEHYDMEIRLITAKGNQIWTRTICHPQRVDGKTVKLLGTFQDITERKFADDRIKSLLSEKELLLKEVHHRIKNNMNAISSLLTLQAETLKDPSAVAALKESGSRVRGMMVLYDKLYRSADFNTISVLKYLPSLVDEIVANFSNSKSVKIEKKIDDFILDAKRLQPLGIIINELLTNIMKYAFTGKDGDSITISATLAGNNVSLVIEDNGNGMPESIDFENSPGFGLMLVGILTEQLEGTIRIERENGTRIILEFEI